MVATRLKRLLCYFLAMLMILCQFPMTVHAEDNVKDIVLTPGEIIALKGGYKYRISKQNLVDFCHNETFYSTVGDLSKVSLTTQFAFGSRATEFFIEAEDEDSISYMTHCRDDDIVGVEDDNDANYIIFDLTGMSKTYVSSFVAYDSWSEDDDYIYNYTTAYCGYDAVHDVIVIPLCESSGYSFPEANGFSKDGVLRHGEILTGGLIQFLFHQDTTVYSTSIDDSNYENHNRCPSYKVIDINTGYDVSDWVTYQSGGFSLASSATSKGHWFYLDDTFPEYKYLGIHEARSSYGYVNYSHPVFGVNLDKSYIYYLNYVTGKLITKEKITDVNNIELSDIDGYCGWFDEDGHKVSSNDLTYGSIVYGLPEKQPVRILDIYGNAYNQNQFTKDYFWVIKDSSLNNIKDMTYQIIRPDEYSSNYVDFNYALLLNSTAYQNTSDISGYLYKGVDGSISLTIDEFKDNLNYVSYMCYLPSKLYCNVYDDESFSQLNKDVVYWELAADGLIYTNGRIVYINYFDDSIGLTNYSISKNNLVYKLNVDDLNIVKPLLVNCTTTNYQYKRYDSETIFNRLDFNGGTGSLNDITSDNFNYSSRNIYIPTSVGTEPDCVNDGDMTISMNNYSISLNSTVNDNTIMPALGHKWNDTDWFLIDANNPDTFSDITDINSSVVDASSLFSNSNNSVNQSLLQNDTYKLFARLCDRAQDAYELDIRHVHKYGEPTFDWSDDYSSCKATFLCKENDDVKVLDCIVTNEGTPVTCTQDGTNIYVATVELDGQTYSDTKSFSEGKLGHEYGEPTFKWSDDYSSCTATFECVRGDDTQVLDCVVTADKTDATCNNSGRIDYTATVEFEGKTYTDDKFITLSNLGHTYKQPVFDWSDDYSSCTATFECVRGDDTQVLDCDVEKDIVSATCTTDGKTEYVATVVFKGQSYSDTKSFSDGKLGHEYGQPEFIWSDDYETCKAKFICLRNDDTQLLDCDVVKNVTTASCTAGGEVEYVATVVFKGNSYSDNKIKTVDSLGHEYGQPEFIWSDDYETCKAKFTCIRHDDTQLLDCDVAKTVTDATCTVDGKTEYVTTVVFKDQSYSDSKVCLVGAFGHEFGEWYVVTKPTYHEYGVEQHDCIRSDLSETRPIDKLTKIALISGVLKDANGNPIANKLVELHSNPMYTYTDANGYFEFKDVEIGKHTLKVLNNENSVLCELALNVDFVESDANETYIDKGFSWDKDINESDIHITINGISDPDDKPILPPETGDSVEPGKYLVLMLLSAFVGLLTLKRRAR